MDVLRIATAGSVDDGKSTLIGRLLLECRAVMEDHLAAVDAHSAARGFDYTDLALLTDGLRAEREQGITIDVAYRYFRTPRRAFVLADTPGHVQYTRNMVTGASTADLGVVLVDARTGPTEQTRRHLLMLDLLGVRSLIVAVNKMDTVGYAQQAFIEVREHVLGFAKSLSDPHIEVVPVAALHGDNVASPSAAMPWHTGPPLLRLLETWEAGSQRPTCGVRLPVQLVIRPQRHTAPDFRGYAGRLCAGSLHVGDPFLVLPGGHATSVRRITIGDREVESAADQQSICLELADQLDIARGDVLCSPHDVPQVTPEVDAEMAWLSGTPLLPGSMWTLRHTTRSVRAIIDRVDDLLDVTTAERHPHPGQLALHQIGRVHLRTTEPLIWDPYATNRTTGSFVLVDPRSNDTAAAGILV